MSVRIFAADDDVLEVGTSVDQVCKFEIERFRHDQHPCPAVGEHEAVIILGEQRVHRHCDHAGLDGGEECGRPIDGIEQADENAFFTPDAERPQYITETFDPVGQLAIGPGPARIDIGCLVDAAGVEIALQDIGGKIIRAWNCVAWRHGRLRRRQSVGGKGHMHYYAGACGTGQRV